MSLLSNPQRLATIIIWYWLLSATALLLFAGVVGIGAGTDMRALLTDPIAALSFAQAFLGILMAAVLHLIGTESTWTFPFCLFAVVQQVATGNLVGAGLAVALGFAYRRRIGGASTASHPASAPEAPEQRFLAGALLVFIALASLLVAFAQFSRLVG
ncbi:hypothetical protein [Corynebacterium lowii]|uniref:Uncharacterized protein n=1 Tax=Corynebacterium lowii TaxID=1544413 RepID=A0A0Q0YYJ8_9CORY|nr:hypothetical protein [Corynebacterium lowii]KQB87451.1 hypothetical protein Clow_00510 [Corynebacterium lowii]MDP9851956.1 hypothetical protein [Corynebacterium lowii]